MFDRQELEALAGIPHLRIGYEDDLRTPELQQSTLNRILDWLGLENRPAKTKLRKINSAARSDLIENFDEAREWYSEIEAAVGK